jgi:hypothetical protein
MPNAAAAAASQSSCGASASAKAARRLTCGSAELEREAGRPERDAAYVVQVDEQEGEDDAVPERIREAPREEGPELPREVRIEGAEVRGSRRAHRRSRLQSAR